MNDQFGDFSGLKEIQLPVSVSPREGKYYGTEIVDCQGASVMRLWSDVDSEPSDREKEYFGPEWTREAWSEYCSDSHWERQSDYLMAVFIVKALNLSIHPVYVGGSGHLKYAINRFSVSLNDVENPTEEFKTWKQITNYSVPEMCPAKETAQSRKL